jgi:transposase InsO family protein
MPGVGVFRAGAGSVGRAMREIHAQRHQGSYGSPRMHRELKFQGHAVSENTVARLMKEHGLRARTARKFRPTTDSNPALAVAQNVLDRQFQANRPNEKWVSDITYVWTDEGWLYLAAVEDLYSRKVVGWSLGERLTSDLVNRALEIAIGRAPSRRPSPARLNSPKSSGLGEGETEHAQPSRSASTGASRANRSAG